MTPTKDLLYFFNSTYRNPLRPIEVLKKLFEYHNNPQKIKSLSAVESIANEDVKLEALFTQAKSHKSYSRKKSELQKLGFLKIGQYGEINTINDINHLKPFSQQFNIDFDTEGEWNSNIMLFALSKDKHLEFMYSLIEQIDKKWSAQNRQRLGVSELELIYLYCFLDKYTTISMGDLSDLVITLRNDFNHQTVAKKGHEKDFLRKKIVADFSQTKFQTGRDYIDTLMRTFALTQCFQITRHGMNQNNTFAFKLLSINHNFKEKIRFFIDNSYVQLSAYIQDNSLCTLLYTSFDAVKAYNLQSEEINEVIKNNPDHYSVVDNWEDSPLAWFQYEFNASIFGLQQIKHNDIHYDRYTKKVAIKTYDKTPYGGTTPSMADSFIIMNDLVLTVESSTLMNEYQQCHKEYVQSIEHVSKHMNEYNKKNGLAVVVMPAVTSKFIHYCIKYNFSNALNLESEKTWILALSTKHYVHFIKNINTEEKLLKFMTYMKSVDYNDYSDKKDIFYQIFLNYLTLQGNVKQLKVTKEQTPYKKIMNTDHSLMKNVVLLSHYKNMKKDNILGVH